VELALLGLETLHLPLQRCQLTLQGGLLRLELGGLGAQGRLLGEQLGLLLLELAFWASSCACWRSSDACWDFSELDSAVSVFCLRSRSAWFAFAWLYLSSYSWLGRAGGLSLVAVSRGPLYPGPYALASRSKACRSVVSPGVAPMSS
jgi:hypothetical protein